MRISGGLALIGAIVAEIAAGSAGQGSGLAYRIVESGFRLNIPRMFAALLLISVAGITIHVLLTALSHWLLSDWHESERGREALNRPREPDVEVDEAAAGLPLRRKLRLRGGERANL